MSRQLVQADVVRLDEMGYLPFPTSGGALLVHLIGQRCQFVGFVLAGLGRRALGRCQALLLRERAGAA